MILLSMMVMVTTMTRTVLDRGPDYEFKSGP